MRNKSRIKKRIRELKRRRTMALVDGNSLLVNEINNEIEKLRIEINPAKPKEIIEVTVEHKPKNEELDVVPVDDIIEQEVKKVEKPKLTPEFYIEQFNLGKSDVEIAGMLGCKVGSIYSAKHYWRKRGKLPELNVSNATKKEEGAKKMEETTNVQDETIENKELEEARAYIKKLEEEVKQLRIVRDIAKPFLVEWAKNL